MTHVSLLESRLQSSLSSSNSAFDTFRNVGMMNQFESSLSYFQFSIELIMYYILLNPHKTQELWQFND